MSVVIVTKEEGAAFASALKDNVDLNWTGWDPLPRELQDTMPEVFLDGLSFHRKGSGKRIPSAPSGIDDHLIEI
jgi:hypothetical protein